jgi:competence protein ComEC
LCDVPGGGDVLVNAGDAGVSRRVVRWLREQGVDRLGALVLAAPTADVAGGVPALLEQIDVEEIWIGPQPARSRVFTRALDLARERGIAIRNVTAGSHGRLAGGVGWEVLHPSVAGPQAIDGALVVRFARDASSVLIRSPAAASQEARILASAVEPTADVAVMEAIEPSEAWLRAAGNPVVVQPGAWEQSVVEFDDAKGAHVADGG